LIGLLKIKSLGKASCDETGISTRSYSSSIWLQSRRCGFAR
jgi:hypothetical protein